MAPPDDDGLMATRISTCVCRYVSNVVKFGKTFPAYDELYEARIISRDKLHGQGVLFYFMVFLNIVAVPQEGNSSEKFENCNK